MRLIFWACHPENALWNADQWERRILLPVAGRCKYSLDGECVLALCGTWKAIKLRLFRKDETGFSFCKSVRSKEFQIFSSFPSVLRTNSFTALTHVLFYISFSHESESVMENNIKMNIGENSVNMWTKLSQMRLDFVVKVVNIRVLVPKFLPIW